MSNPMTHGFMLLSITKATAPLCAEPMMHIKVVSDNSAGYDFSVWDCKSKIQNKKVTIKNKSIRTLLQIVGS